MIFVQHFSHALRPVIASVATLLSLSHAAAQSCTASFTDVAFGTIDITPGAAITTTGAVTVNCTGTANTTVRFCINLGGGSGGGGIASRRMANTANGAIKLAYNLFQDPGYTTLWGSSCCGYPPATIDVPLSGSGAGSASKTIYGVVGAAQASPPGSYLSSFNANGHATLWWFDASAGTCSAVGSGAGALNGGPVVTATVVKACTIAAGNLNFGTTGVLGVDKDATSTLTLTCSNSTPYTVGLSAGAGAGATTELRQMTGAGGATIGYTLYRDAARTQLWGTTIGADTFAGTGTGVAQSVTVYGRVPAQATPAPGVYADTVNVTVTY